MSVTSNSLSVWDVIQQQYDKYQTRTNTKDTFREGDPVKLIVPAQDFCFFDMENTFGRIIEARDSNSTYPYDVLLWNRQTDKIMGVFNFKPQDLIYYPLFCDHKKEQIIKKYLIEKFGHETTPVYILGSNIIYLGYSYSKRLLRWDVERNLKHYFAIDEIYIKD